MRKPTQTVREYEYFVGTIRCNIVRWNDDHATINIVASPGPGTPADPVQALHCVYRREDAVALRDVLIELLEDWV